MGGGGLLTSSSWLLIILPSAALQRKERHQWGQKATNGIKSSNRACPLRCCCHELMTHPAKEKLVSENRLSHSRRHFSSLPLSGAGVQTLKSFFFFLKCNKRPPLLDLRGDSWVSSLVCKIPHLKAKKTQLLENQSKSLGMGIVRIFIDTNIDTTLHNLVPKIKLGKD